MRIDRHKNFQFLEYCENGTIKTGVLPNNPKYSIMDYLEPILTIVCAIAIIWIINYNSKMGD
jgi:hypothetical protein